MFGEGFGFGVTAVFVSLCTIVFGGLVTLIAWWTAICDKSTAKYCRRFPAALYTFTISLVSDLIGMAVLSIMPYRWEQYYVLGDRLRPFIYSIFMLISFAAVIISALLLRGKNGKVIRVLVIGSAVLIVVNVIGITNFIMSLPGMPLH